MKETPIYIIMEGINARQLKQLHTLLSLTNLTNEKAVMVAGASGQRCTSSKELTRLEADALIQHLINVDKSMNKMRKKMLHYGYLMGYDNPINTQQNGLEAFKINILNVSAWCISDKSKYKMPMTRLNPDQLKDTVSQFERVYKSFNKSIHNYGNQQTTSKS